MFSRIQNYPVWVYVVVHWLGGEDRQSVVTDDKMESSEYSYSVQLKKKLFSLYEWKYFWWPLGNLSPGYSLWLPEKRRHRSIRSKDKRVGHENCRKSISVNTFNFHVLLICLTFLKDCRWWGQSFTNLSCLILNS